MTFWSTEWQAMQFFFCASSGFANTGAEIRQTITIAAVRTWLMRFPDLAAKRRSASIRITDGTLAG